MRARAIKPLNREQWLFCLQLGLSMMLAYFVTHGSDPTNAINAVLGAGLATTPSFGEGLGVSKERIVGTLLGALVSLAAMWLHNPIVALAVTVTIIGPIGIMLGGFAIARIGVTVAAVTVLLHTDTADVYAFLRFTNTVAGVAVALAVALMLWPLSRQMNFFLTLRSTVAAGALLAEQLASAEPAFPLEGQRKLFMALVALPKSLSHVQLDPLAHHHRGRLREEASVAVKIGIALLAASLAFNRGHATLQEAEIASLQASFRHLAARLHQLHQRLAGRFVLPAAKPEPALMIDDGDGAPVRFARLVEELRAIDGWLDDLERLLADYSAASLVPNRLRAKRG